MSLIILLNWAAPKCTVEMFVRGTLSGACEQTLLNR